MQSNGIPSVISFSQDSLYAKQLIDLWAYGKPKDIDIDYDERYRQIIEKMLEYVVPSEFVAFKNKFEK